MQAQRLIRLSHPDPRRIRSSKGPATVWSRASHYVVPNNPYARNATHLELGWAAGAGKKTGILLHDGEPELMYSMVDHLFIGM